MRAGRLFKLFKVTSLLTVGAGVGYFGGKLGLIYNPFYKRDETIHHQFESISQEHKEFLINNNYTEPHYFYDILQRRKQTTTFFEKSLLCDLKTFKLLDFFITKDFYDELMGDKPKITEAKEDTIVKTSKGSLACIFRANENAQGHMGIIHGGVTATLIDTFFGAFGFMLNGLSPVATTNLQINFSKPLIVGNEYMLVCEVEKKEGRHIFMKSYIREPNGEILCESTSRFTKVDWGSMAFKMLFGGRGESKPQENQKTSEPKGLIPEMPALRLLTEKHPKTAPLTMPSTQ